MRFIATGERAAIAAIAVATGAAFTGLWLDAPLEIMITRVATRSGDASDATPPVVVAQAATSPGVVDWIVCDATGGMDDLIARASAILAGDA